MIKTCKYKAEGWGWTCSNLARKGKDYCWRHDGTPKKSERLQAENTKLKEELKGKDELLFAYESVRAPVNPLYAENERLKKALKRYGHHDSPCALLMDLDDEICICGFEQALKGATDGQSDGS